MKTQTKSEDSSTASSSDSATRPGGRFTVYDLKGPSPTISQWSRIPDLTREALRLVWRAGRKRLLLVVGLQFVAAAMIGLQLVVGRRVLQELMAVAGNGQSLRLAPELALLVGATVLAGFLGALVAHQQRYLTELVGKHSFDRIIDVASSVELAQFEDPIFYDQLSRARMSAMYRPIEMVNSIATLLMSVMTSVGIGAVLFTMYPALIPLIVLAGVPLLVATLINSQESHKFEYAWTPQSRERAYLLELLTGREPAKELRVFDATSYLRHRYDDLTAERISRLEEFLRRRTRTLLGGSFLGAVGAVIALGCLVWLVGTRRIDVATAVTAGAAMQLLMTRFNAMTKALGSLVEAGMFLDDYRAFLLTESASPGPRLVRPRPLPKPFLGLEVQNVTFAYPKTDAIVLGDVSLHVEPGEVVAVVGENGSGKTTLVKLICRLYRPQRGRILWKGVDSTDGIADVTRPDITVIFQDFIHYHLTATENIALGRADQVDDPQQFEDAVRVAAMQAGAHDFISRLPNGYRTRLGRQFYGGHELSVGQWQLLALARAFFRGGEFIILDEPTASLDPRAEYELFTQMRSLASGRSVLLVSHRFSSVRSADRIYVMREGRIIESGSHDELLSVGGHYSDLFHLQAAAYLEGWS